MIACFQPRIERAARLLVCALKMRNSKIYQVQFCKGRLKPLKLLAIFCIESFGASATKANEAPLSVTFSPVFRMKKTLLLLSLTSLIPLSARAQDPNLAPVAPPVAPPSATATAPTAPATPATPPAQTAPATATPPVTSAAPASDAANMDDATKLREATLAYNAGLAAIKNSDWNAAEASFGRAAMLSPGDAGAFSFLGYVRLQQKNWDGALTALQAAQDNGKDLDVAARAQLLNNIGFARWNKNENVPARAAFEEALKLQPDYYDARYNLAFALLSSDQFADALPHLKTLQAKNPDDAAIEEGLGEAFDRTGNSASALGAYKRAITLDPKNENYRFKFALILLNNGRRDDALSALRELLTVNPNNAPALLQIGDIHLRSNNYTDAAAALRRYVNVRGDDFTGRFNLGVALDYGSKFDEALEQYGAAEKLKPNDAATKNNIGRIYFKRGRFDEAVAKFNEALVLDPAFYDARTNLAIVLAAQNKLDMSSAEWQTLATDAAAASRGANIADRKALEARIATARSGIASNLLAQNKFKEAADEYRKLLALTPADAEARSGLGRALYNLKDYAGAETAYRAIIAAYPKNANAYNDLGVVLEAKGDRAGALDNYQKALDLAPDHNEAESNVARLKGAAAVG